MEIKLLGIRRSLVLASGQERVFGPSNWSARQGQEQTFTTQLESVLSIVGLHLQAVDRQQRATGIVEVFMHQSSLVQVST